MLSKLTVISINSAITVQAEKGFRNNIRDRKYYGLTFCSHGCIQYSQNTKTCISDTSTVVLLPMGESYSLYCTESGTFPVINFTCSEPLPINCPTSFSIRDTNTYLSQFQRLKKLLNNEIKRPDCFRIFYDMISSIVSDNVSANPILSAAVSYLLDNISDPLLTNKKIAEHVNVSEIYFRKLFANTYGFSPKQYIIALRMQQAKQLLSEQKLSIAAVAEKCGYANAYHFSKAFRAHTGNTPSQFRKTEAAYGL